MTEEKIETEENKETQEDATGQIMKHYGKCKGCGRTEKTYRDLCFWDFIEKTKEITEELAKEIRDCGRSSLIDIAKMKQIRDKLLELV